MEIALGAGAEDLKEEAGNYSVITSPQDYMPVREAIEKAGIAITSSELTMIPKNEAPVSAEGARGVLKLIEALEDHEDVQNVYANCDIPDEVMKELA